MAVDAQPVPRTRSSIWRPRRRGKNLTTAGLIAPPLRWLVNFFAIPVVLVGLLSGGGLVLFPGDEVWTQSSGEAFLDLDAVYLGLVW